MERNYGYDPRKRDFNPREKSLKRKLKLNLERKLERERELEKELTIPTLSLQQDVLEISIGSPSTNENTFLDRNHSGSDRSRGVFVPTPKTILPTPDGRRKKKSNTAKSEIIKFRCTIYEKKVLKVKSKRSGLTLSEYCRKVAFQGKITERLSDEQIDIYKMLINYHINFKRIGNMFHKRDPELTKTVNQLADEIKNHLKKFKQ
jgi:hypothetical protein